MFGADLNIDFVLCDLATGQERLRLPGYTDVDGMAISPDGNRLVLVKSFLGSGGDYERELSFWNLKSGKRLMAFNLAGSISDMAFSPDSNRLIAAVSSTGSTAKPIQIWDATPLAERP